MTQAEQNQIGVLSNKIDTLMEEVKALRPLAEVQAVHTEQIKQLKGFVCEVNSRQWWLIGIMVVALLGIVAKVISG